MAAAPAATPQQPVSAQVVGNVFVQQYYHILHQSPGVVHRFYQDISKVGRPEEDGSMSITTTMEEINSKILSLNYDEFKAEIKSVDAQESLNGGVTVLVTGCLTGKDNVLRKFTQSFFLAPQDKGYFVLNDMFRYIEESNLKEENIVPTEEIVAPINPEQVSESVSVVVNNIPEPVAVSEKVEAVVVKEEELVPEVINEVQEEVSQVIAKSDTEEIVKSDTKTEETPKKSYASIVMDLKQNGVPFSSPAPAPRKLQLRNQEQHVKNVSPTVSAPGAAASNVNAVENGVHEEEAEGYSIYIKGLPMSATPIMLGDELKKFGSIKPNGIQVRSIGQQGFCFGFVEFETPDAAQKAIDASPVLIGGRKAVVEEKRSTNGRGGPGRYPGGRGGGFRDEGMRGRGSVGGGRGFNRGGEFGGGRNDYGGNRGGGRNDYGGNRGGGRNDYGGNRSGGGGNDGNQRERVNRGVGVNGTTKNVAPRVSATA
ncbi:nuclear transport factor 2-like [Rutidosis leptorrhynchoides]|uniref:nuclear transport factor 2-like n=1 Tax=Rutidosis leptorrhynchoides TaxID=125765 RepID=UPI003A99A3F4